MIGNTLARATRILPSGVSACARIAGTAEGRSHLLAVFHDTRGTPPPFSSTGLLPGTEGDDGFPNPRRNPLRFQEPQRHESCSRCQKEPDDAAICLDRGRGRYEPYDAPTLPAVRRGNRRRPHAAVGDRAPVARAAKGGKLRKYLEPVPLPGNGDRGGHSERTQRSTRSPRPRSPASCILTCRRRRSGHTTTAPGSAVSSARSGWPSWRRAAHRSP